MLNNLPYILIALTTALTLGLLFKEFKRSRKTLEAKESEELEKTHEQALKELQEVYTKAQQSLAQQESVEISQFDTKLSQSTDALLKNFQDLLNKSADSIAGNMNQRMNVLFESFENKLTEMLDNTQKKSVQAIELELKAARNLIDTYKAQQLSIVDENIISMLEKTLALVLAKKLTLKDQLELVYEALEKAKAEKFIIWGGRR